MRPLAVIKADLALLKGRKLDLADAGDRILVEAAELVERLEEAIDMARAVSTRRVGWVAAAKDFLDGLAP